jgi:MFS family permease
MTSSTRSSSELPIFQSYSQFPSVNSLSIKGMEKDIEMTSKSSFGRDGKMHGEVSEIERLESMPTERGRKYYEPITELEVAINRRVNLKFDIFVVTLLAINFLLAGIDKTNIGNAATTSKLKNHDREGETYTPVAFVKDANLHPNDISDAVSLLSVTFVTLQPFSTIMGRWIGPKYWIPTLMICWGSLCMAHAGIKGRGTLIALRLLLGAAEAGFVPTTFYYLSTIYPSYSLGFRLGLFSGMYSIAGAFAGLIAYGVFQIKSDMYKGWQILFLLEGGLTLFMAAVSMAALPRRVETAWFLTPAERLHAVHRMEVDMADDLDIDAEGRVVKENKMVTKRDVLDALKDWKKLFTVVFNIFATLPVSAFGTFLPLVVKGMGYTGVKANLMSVPPFVV